MILAETGYAKLNLALHVRRRRADGYHDIETVFAFCADGDVLTAEAAAMTTLTIDGPFAAGLSAHNNLIVRAAACFGRTAQFRLTKNLPVASGIGGGSADAAAALRLLARLYDAPLPDAAAVLRLGADVPACVASATARAEGVGECLSPGPAVTGLPVLLVNPGVAVATPAVFAAWDGIDRGALGDWREGRNDLEAAAVTQAPAIAPLLEALRRCPGASFVRMSGSGATCFAVFADGHARDAAALTIRDRFPSYWQMTSVLR